MARLRYLRSYTPEKPRARSHETPNCIVAVGGIVCYYDIVIISSKTIEKDPQHLDNSRK